MNQISDKPTPWAVICYEHKQVFLTEEEYDRQMQFSNRTWICPRCGDHAVWDDLNYERAIDDGTLGAKR